MARTADREARRRQILGGVGVVARRDGLGNVTIQRTALAAGISVGLVQHYYPSKDALLTDAFDDVRSAIAARVDVEITRAEQRSDRIEQMLASGLSQLLPLDSHRLDEVYLAHAFAGLALEQRPLREHLASANAELQQQVTSALDNGKDCGEVVESLNTSEAAYALLSLTDGLAARLLVEDKPVDRASATAALDGAVAALCPGPCHNRP